MKIKKAGCLAVIALLILAAVFFWGKSVGNSAGTTKMDAVVLESQLTEISELASLTYSYTNMAEFENSKDFYGIKLPFTTKSFIITYDGEIKYGIDLSKAKVSVSGSRIEIGLPAVKILSHEIDEDSLEVFDENTSIFNPLRVEDYNAFNKDQKAEMERKALDKGILTQASEKAGDAVETFVRQVAGEDYTVEVLMQE